MGSAIIGFEYWTKDNKPVRSREPFKETPNIKMGKDGRKQIKHFWAFPVWNYKAGQIQILELTQATIQRGIKALVDSQEWGDPKNYDISINRVGEDLSTEYSVFPSPHKDTPQEALEAYAKIPLDLTRLYEGKDPFMSDATSQEIDPDIGN